MNSKKLVAVDGHQMMALIDSGSRVTTIKSSMAKMFGNREPTDLWLKGFGGRRIRVEENVDAVLQVDEVSEKVDFIVVPNYAQDLPVIESATSLATLDNWNENDFNVKEICAIRSYLPITEDDINSDGKEVLVNEVLNCVSEFRDCFSKSYGELGK
ncbi:uncharacterized protein LOC129737620 [Uranotaenia lowii]|uniref:uncharacterized protein LOC129737620 n=1 Tax=Uranotaenia lowii TaxID=190385 RepID=UPI0024783F07|nr:uncharacterized protein LOC129737620 [Uranotaenia lowii]